MENKEIRVSKTESSEKDSFGLKIAMAILAVAVVVLTLINAAPFNAKGETNKAVIPENQIAVTRIVHRNTNADRNGAEEVEQGKFTQGEENEDGYITVDEIAAETAAPAAIA